MIIVKNETTMQSSIEGSKKLVFILDTFAPETWANEENQVLFKVSDIYYQLFMKKDTS